jgi:hypothetical protein
MNTRTSSARPFISFAIGVMAFTGLTLAFGIAKETGTVDATLATRGAAISIGLTMMVAANFLPKLVPPRVTPRSGLFTAMSPERFAGWTFVLAAIAYVAVLAAAPIKYALPVAGVVGLCAFAVAGANWAWAMLSKRAGDSSKTALETPADEDPAVHSSEMNKRRALLMLFFSFFWVFLTFLADSIWGDSVSRGMAVVFVILLAVATVVPLLKQGQGSVERPD